MTLLINKRIVSVVSIIVLVSCLKGIDNPTPPQKSNFITLEEAKENVIKMLTHIEDDTKGEQGTRFISEVFSYPNDVLTKDKQGEEYPLLYMMNFNDNQGFAIASGDSRLPSVLCITEKGSLERDTLRLPIGAITLLSLVEEEYKQILTRGDSLEGPIPHIMESYQTYGDWADSFLCGTRIAANWDQSSPFNDYCPIESGQHCYVGCVAVAVGQIMYYWGQNIVYNNIPLNWNLMHEVINSETDTTMYATGWNMVKHLLCILGDGDNLDMDYGINGSGASINNVPRTFENFLFTSGGIKSNYSFNSVNSEIIAGRPVIGRGNYAVETLFGIPIGPAEGSGHEWVYDQTLTQSRPIYRIDIYDDDTYTVTQISTEYRHYVDCNWGWDGEYNGFFLSGNFDSHNLSANFRPDVVSRRDKPYYYQYYLEILTGIYP